MRKEELRLEVLRNEELKLEDFLLSSLSLITSHLCEFSTHLCVSLRRSKHPNTHHTHKHTHTYKYTNNTQVGEGGIQEERTGEQGFGRRQRYIIKSLARMLRP